MTNYVAFHRSGLKINAAKNMSEHSISQIRRGLHGLYLVAPLLWRETDPVGAVAGLTTEPETQVAITFSVTLQ